MLLCDIGNTSYHFLDGEHHFKESALAFDPSSVTEQVYYISVNADVSAKLKTLKNWSDLGVYIDKTLYYESMGIDRIIAVEATHNGIIVDAGSAITVDVVEDGVFMGGFITVGINAMQKAYASVSPALAGAFHFSLDTSRLPKNTQDAISYGYLKPLQTEINSYNLPIILTGGDARKLLPLFENAVVDEMLLFKGMKKLLHKTLSNL